MMNKRKKDKISSLFFVAVAIGICYESTRLSFGEVHKPGPGFFSFIIGAILGFLSLAVFLRSFKDLPGDEREPFWSNPKREVKMVYVLIALILYTVGMKYLGFSLTTFLFLSISYEIYRSSTMVGGFFHINPFNYHRLLGL